MTSIQPPSARAYAVLLVGCCCEADLEQLPQRRQIWPALAAQLEHRELQCMILIVRFSLVRASQQVLRLIELTTLVRQRTQTLACERVAIVVAS